MAIDNTRTSIELETEIANILNRSVSEINTRQLLNDAIRQVSMDLNSLSYRGTDKLTIAANTTWATITGYWKFIRAVYLIYNGVEIPLEPMNENDIALYVSGYSKTSTAGAIDTTITTTSIPQKYAILPAQQNVSGTLDTNFLWWLFVYPKTDAAYNLRFEGQLYPDYLPYTLYNTGTITITGVSAAVVGASTVWSTVFPAPFTGNYLWVGTETTSTKIQATTDDTHITLASTHAAAAGGTAYAIKQQENWFTVEVPNILKAKACELGFAILGEHQEEQVWENRYDKAMTQYKVTDVFKNLNSGFTLTPFSGAKRRNVGL